MDDYKTKVSNRCNQLYIFIVDVTSHPTCFGPLLAHHQGCRGLLVYAKILMDGLKFSQTPKETGVTRWRSWLRHCDTRRNVAGLISDGVTEIFYWHKTSGRTIVLRLTQPLTEMRTRYISWGQRCPVRRADNRTTFMCRLSWNLGASTSCNSQGLSRPVMQLLSFNKKNSILCVQRNLKSLRRGHGVD
jgi:hypothetical protein